MDAFQTEIAKQAIAGISMDFSPPIFQRDLLGPYHQGRLPYDDGDHEFIRESVDESKLPPLGRVLSALLSAKPQELQSCISQNDPSRHKGSISRALAALLQHANFAVQRGTSLNKLLVPLLEHTIKSRDRSNRKQVVSIMDWLLQKVSICIAIVDGFVAILQSKQVDHRIKLGWCVVVRDLLQQRVQTNESPSGVWDVKLVPFVSCIPDLLSLMSESSSKDMPTRLSVMAADCIILVSKYVGEHTSSSLEKAIQISAPDDVHEIEVIDTSTSSSPSVLHRFDPAQSTSHDASTSGRTAVLAKEELLWEQLDALLKFVLKLKKWNEESRPLYAKGLQQIVKCLENLVHFRDALQAQDRGEEDLVVLMAVLSSCWNRYGVLMLVDSSTVRMDSKVMLQQWIEGLQHSLQVEETEEDDEVSQTTTRRVGEIRVFFLTCLTLLLGRLSPMEMEGIVQEYGAVLLHALFGQLRGKHVDALDLAVAILRTLLFRTESANASTLKMDTIAPSLIDLLDEQDSTSRAVVALIADYFAMYPFLSNIT